MDRGYSRMVATKATYRTTRNKYCDDYKPPEHFDNPYEELAMAIVLQAAKDYLLNYKSSDGRRIEEFFRSQWFQILQPQIDGESILLKLKQFIKEKNNDEQQ